MIPLQTPPRVYREPRHATTCTTNVVLLAVKGCIAAVGSRLCCANRFPKATRKGFTLLHMRTCRALFHGFRMLLLFYFVTSCSSTLHKVPGAAAVMPAMCTLQECSSAAGRAERGQHQAGEFGRKCNAPNHLCAPGRPLCCCPRPLRCAPRQQPRHRDSA